MKKGRKLGEKEKKIQKESFKGFKVLRLEKRWENTDKN